MLQEAKKALRITASAYDSEIVSLIEAGAMDLQIAGIVIPEDDRTSAEETGKITEEISFTETEETTEVGEGEDAETITTYVIVDNSTLSNPLIKRAILTYVRMNFGTPPDYDRLKKSYDEQKAQMQTATGYTTGGPFSETEEDETGSQDGTGTGTQDGTGEEDQDGTGTGSQDGTGEEGQNGTGAENQNGDGDGE